MGSSKWLPLAVIVAVIAVAVLAVAGPPGRVAQAHEFTLVPGALLVHKHCDPEGGLGGTFDVDVEVTVDPDAADPEIFSYPLTIECDDLVRLSETESDVDISDLLDFIGTVSPITTNLTLSITEESQGPWLTTTYADNDGVEDEDCGFGPSNLLTLLQGQLAQGYACVITNTFDTEGLSVVTVTKEFDGGDDTPFTYLIDSLTGTPCLVVIDAVATVIPDGGTFSILPPQTAEVFCANDLFTISEQLDDSFTFVTLGCTPSEGFETWEVVGESVSFRIPIEGATLDCTWTNEVDNPDIIVKKECVGIEGVFSFQLDGLTAEIPCGESDTASNLEPGTYTLSEDPGVGDIATLIACSDGQQVTGTSVTVEVVDADIFCVFINSAEDLGDVVCPCPCGCGNDLEIDIDNTNTNVIGIENENENKNTNDNTNNNANTNTNTNTQNQTNDQSQDNTNEQTNNITSSPEVNIDFD